MGGKLNDAVVIYHPNLDASKQYFTGYLHLLLRKGSQPTKIIFQMQD